MADTSPLIQPRSFGTLAGGRYGSFEFKGITTVFGEVIILQPSEIDPSSAVWVGAEMEIDQPSEMDIESAKVYVAASLQPQQPSQLELSPDVLENVILNLTMRAPAQFVVVSTPPEQHAKIYPYNRWSDMSLGTISADNFPPAFPPSNTQIQQRSKVWRSVGLDDARLFRDLGAAYRISAISLVSTNSTRDGTFRVRISNNADMSAPVYDSGDMVVWVPFLPTTSDFSDGTGFPKTEILDLITFCTESARTIRTLDFTEVSGQYIDITFHDTGNPDGFFEVAWVYAGLSVELSEGVGYGFKWWPESVNNILKSEDGRLLIDVYYRQLFAEAPITTYPTTRMMGLWQFLADYLGTSREFVIKFRDDSVKEGFWFGMYGKFTEVPKLLNNTNETWSGKIAVEELV